MAERATASRLAVEVKEKPQKHERSRKAPLAFCTTLWYHGARMSKSKKLLILLGCVIVLGVIGYLILPSVLVRYVNGMMPGVHVDYVSLKSLDCVNLKGITINRGNINGNITSAIACRNAKTIVSDGGSVSLTLKSDTKANSSSTDVDKYRIVAKNLSLKVQKDDSVLQLNNAGVDGFKVFAPTGVATTEYGTVTFENITADRKTKTITFDRAKTSKDGIGDISVSGVQCVVDNIINISIKYALIKHDTNLSVGGTGISVKFSNGIIKIDANTVFGSHPMLYLNMLTVQNVDVNAFALADVKTANHSVKINGVYIGFNVAERRVTAEDADCADWLRALPNELKTPPIDQVKFKGTLGFSLETQPQVKFKLHNNCSIDGPIPSFIKALSGKFAYTAYHPNSGGKFERVSGPGSLEWVPFELVSDTMVKALTTTEDPGFFSHRGIIPQAIENSIRDNLRLGKFFRGGSTITMQLAKNLWLSRKRTLGRKIQEAILTVALESSLPKEKILELYLNVVEFGPDLYGIGPGANKLLGTPPSNITLSQALYLVLRLPAPSRSGTYEQMKGKIAKMLDLMITSGKVTEEEAGYEKAFLFEDFNDE